MKKIISVLFKHNKFVEMLILLTFASTLIWALTQWATPKVTEYIISNRSCCYFPLSLKE